jgi:lactoylglutathione lyase
MELNMAVKYLHSMIRVSDPEATIALFELIGLKETRRFSNEAGKFTLIFLAAPGQEDVAEVELTHNLGRGRLFGRTQFRAFGIPCR